MKYSLKDNGYLLLYTVEGGFDTWEFSTELTDGLYVSSYTQLKHLDGVLIFDNPEDELKVKNLIKNQWRIKRDVECFPFINRGQLWYETLTPEQMVELNDWYNLWLDVTNTLIEPTKPGWI